MAARGRENSLRYRNMRVLFIRKRSAGVDGGNVRWNWQEVTLKSCLYCTPVRNENMCLHYSRGMELETIQNRLSAVPQ